MDALLFALTLEVVLLQMRILEGSSELRLKNWRPTNRIQKLQLNKLVQDREIVRDIIRKTLIEVIESGEYDTIKGSINLLKENDCDEKTLRLKNNALRESRSAVLNELDEKRNQWGMELQDADQQVAVLRDRMSDDVLNATIRLSYAEKWLYARFESLELQHDVPQQPKPRTDHEDRVHKELIYAYELQIKEREKALKYWGQRYNTDMAVISIKVQEKCEQLRIASEKRDELQKLVSLLLCCVLLFYIRSIANPYGNYGYGDRYNLHEGEMRGWLTFKRERAARLAREEKNRLSAVRIQAWWRGVMVRKALGQFKHLRQSKKQTSKGKKK